MEERLLVFNFLGAREETNKSTDKDGKDKTPANNQQQSNRDKNSVKCWNCNGTGHYSKDCPKNTQSLSAVVCHEQPSSSGATGETTLSGFFLNAFEEEAELNSFESKISGVLVASTVVLRDR